MMKHIDKNSIKHFGVNFALSVFGLYGACIGMGASITKEYCDKIYVKHWCWADIAVDVLGIIAGLGVNYLIMGKIAV